MRKLILSILSAAVPSLAVMAQVTVVPDSTATTLGEVVVSAETVSETAKKMIIRPSVQDRKHSTNGYQLLANINLPDLEVDPSVKTISTIGGQSVGILIDGVEARIDELATLPASEIARIDYQRKPGGRYVGQGAVINFITRRLRYGGNVYLSADEGILRQYGNYTGNVNFKKDAVTLSFTANGQWQRTSELNREDNSFELGSGSLDQNISPQENLTRSNSEYARLKFQHTANRHSFDASLSLTRSEVPCHRIKDLMTYTGIHDFRSVAERRSRERALSPSLRVNYRLYLPGDNTLSLEGDLTSAHSRYAGAYSETGLPPELGGTDGQSDILNATVEDKLGWSATVSWFKEMPSGITIGADIDNMYDRYTDRYSGSFDRRQKLINNHAEIMLHWQHRLPCGLYYYLSAGMTDLYSAIGDNYDNQLTPMCFYGANWAVDRRHSFSLSGSYLHSIYNPAYKNDAVIRTSFFQAEVGNPDLRQLKAFQNSLSYNGRVGAVGLSAIYDFMKYFDNTSPEYFVVDNVVCRRLINDGTFHTHRFIAGASLNLIDDRLKINANCTYTLYRFDSLSRPERSNNLRFSSKISYMFGDWQLKGVWSPAFKGTDINGERFRMSAQYGVILNWNRGNWGIECTVKNFLHRYRSVDRTIVHDCYRSVSHALSDAIGRNVCISLTYTLPYGKKTDREKIEPETSVKSAILKPF